MVVDLLQALAGGLLRLAGGALADVADKVDPPTATRVAETPDPLDPDEDEGMVYPVVIPSEVAKTMVREGSEFRPRPPQYVPERPLPGSAAHRWAQIRGR